VAWRIHETTPVTGITTEFTSAGLIQVATRFGLPVSAIEVDLASSPAQARLLRRPLGPGQAVA